MGHLKHNKIQIRNNKQIRNALAMWSAYIVVLTPLGKIYLGSELEIRLGYIENRKYRK
jgi:hypothetical protein